MKKLVILFLTTAFILQSCESKDSIENTIWKYCDDQDSGYISDILDFRKNNMHVRNDTIFNKKDSAIARIDRIEYYHGEKRLFLKDFKGKITRYCEK